MKHVNSNNEIFQRLNYMFFQLWFYKQYAKEIIPSYVVKNPIKRIITFKEFVNWVIKSDPDHMDL